MLARQPPDSLLHVSLLPLLLLLSTSAVSALARQRQHQRRPHHGHQLQYHRLPRPSSMRARRLVLAGAAEKSAARSEIGGEDPGITRRPMPRRMALGGTLGLLFPLPLLLATATARAEAGAEAEAAVAVPAPADPLAVTSRVYLDVALCPLNRDGSRSVSTNTVLCAEPVKLGRIVIGLYGNSAPDSARNFLDLAKRPEGGYKGSIFQEIHRGEYIVGGKRGRVPRGFVSPEWSAKNSDITNPKALNLRHEQPGTVSLHYMSGLAEGGLGSVFSISTGFEPSLSLDQESVVIGRVLEGLDVVGQIDQLPTFRPSGTFTQLERTANVIGGILGDQRAERARESWLKPKLTVLIQDCGVLM